MLLAVIAVVALFLWTQHGGGLLAVPVDDSEELQVSIHNSVITHNTVRDALYTCTSDIRAALRAWRVR
jgi:hypothetical protein